MKPYENVKNPAVSVIMPAYNCEKYIEDAIRSVMAQTFTDWELIVLDDGSCDSTLEIIERLASEDDRIKLLPNEKNMGVAKTRNRGLDLCSGQYVALLDSDDYWKPQLLEKMISRAKETEVDIVYCSYELVSKEGEKVCKDFLGPPTTRFEDSIVRSVISCSTVLLTKQFAMTHRFPTNTYHEDIALWFKSLQEGATAAGVTEVLASYRQHNDSRSAGKLKSAMRRWVIYRNFLKMPIHKTISAMIRYGYYGVIKYQKI
jgi:teichuronic acid biosynthesis glycosyltransferase TuaG